jgi:hypothetical protein
MAKKHVIADAEQTKKKPGRPKKTTPPKKKGRPKVIKKIYKKKRSKASRRWSVMRVRHVLYKNWPGRYDSFAETRQEANDAIDYMLAIGYQQATFKGIQEYVREVKKVSASRKKKLKEMPDWHQLIPPEIPINTPIPFYNAASFCSSWTIVSPKVYCFSKDIWPGQRFYGGKPIDYSASFARWARQMARLQRQKSGDYTSDWFFTLWVPEYEHKTGEFKVKIISSSSGGEHLKYKEDGSTEPGEEAQIPLPKGRVEPIPEKPEIKPEEKPAAPAAEPTEFTKEDRLELEREKIKAESEAKAKVDIDVKKAKLEQFTKLFSEGKITFEQYEKLVSNI